MVQESINHVNFYKKEEKAEEKVEEVKEEVVEEKPVEEAPVKEVEVEEEPKPKKRLLRRKK